MAMPRPRISGVMRPNCAVSLSGAFLKILVPSVRPVKPSSTITFISRFSTSQPHEYPRRDGNKNRGLSALRRTGLRRRQTLSVKNEPLPKPVIDPSRRHRVEVDPDHGLWQFFNKQRRILAFPEEDSSHGRAWTPKELENRSWEDLHALWWKCVKERNRLATERFERRRLKAGYGDYESRARENEIKKTQKAIKTALTLRWYAWEDARILASEDPEVNLSPPEGQPAYQPLYEHDSNETFVEMEAEQLAQGHPESAIEPPNRTTNTTTHS